MKPVVAVILVLVICVIVYAVYANQTVTLQAVPASNGTNVLVPTPAPAPVPAPVPVVSNLTGTFNADNYLTVYQNNNLVVPIISTDWMSKVSVNVPNVKQGDRIDFVVQNVGGPGGLIGKFTWNGKTYVVNQQLFNSVKVVKLSNNNRAQPTATQLSQAQASKAIVGDSSIWSEYAKTSDYASNTQWVWESGNCESCYAIFSWVAQ